MLPAVDNFEAFALQSEQHWEFDDVDSDRLFVQATHFEFNANFLGDVFGAAHLGGHRAAQHRNPGARTVAQPRTIQLVMPGG